jgi:hypothetical protein
MYAIYLADETALLRELNQPSANLESSAADRLVRMRSLNLGHARRAFRRIADRVSTNSLEVILPRGSRLIYFYGIVPISSTGVEGSLPISANNYVAVATPVVKTPEVPNLVARDVGGVISLSVEVAEIRVPVGHVEIFRAPSRHRAISIEYAGPPIASVDASQGIRSGGFIRWKITDSIPGLAWESVFYRAVSYGVTDRVRGEYGGKSLPSPAIEIVPSSLLPAHLEDLKVEEVSSEPDFRLISFISNVTLARTLRGTHAYNVKTVAQDGSVVIRRVVADTLPLIIGTMPTPIEQPDSIFRYDPVNPRTGRIFAWIPRENITGSPIIAVLVEVIDPVGRITRRTKEFL